MQSSPPVLRFTEGSAVVPGDRIGTIRQVLPGEGTYVKSNGHIYASLVGQLQITEVTHDNKMKEENEEESKDSATTKTTPPSYICSVRTKNLPATSQVLHIGQIVIGRVVRISPQNAIVEIRVAENVGPLRQQNSSSYYEGAIRTEDIRSGATEQIQIEECFRPNDLVACRIVSLGDPRRYFLSTAETELGVIKATTPRGVPMIPVSWKEMECPETGIREPRKCAKPIQLKSATT
jgi:exosome complex component CSL4